MTIKQAKQMKYGDKLLVRGEVLDVHKTGRWVEVQFSNYSLDIPVKDIKRLPKKKQGLSCMTEPDVLKMLDEVMGWWWRNSPERAAVAALVRENICDVCSGTGDPKTGLPCICGGSGKMSYAVSYLRSQVVELRDEVKRLREALEHLENRPLSREAHKQAEIALRGSTS